MIETMPSFYHNKSILVTGAGGFIASHLVETLVGLGARVRAFVRYNSRGDPGLLTQLPTPIQAGLEIIAGDLRDPQAVTSAVQGMEIIFHLGALIAIPYSYLHPYEVVETNVMGTLNLLMAAQAAGTSRVIHTSTSEVYGTALTVPISEAHPLQGQSPYSASKIGADKLAESFYCAYSLPVVTIRPFNTYGPRQSGRAVIPTIISQIIAGGELRLGNLHSLRDFTFVSDTVAGLLKGGETPGIEGQVFNLGTGVEVSIGNLVDVIAAIAGKQVEVLIESERLRPDKSEVMRLISDNSRACSMLGWEPTISLTEGLATTYHWIESHMAFYHAGTYEC
jgi:NAD dependent epimerase/dehydratase